MSDDAAGLTGNSPPDRHLTMTQYRLPSLSLLAVVVQLLPATAQLSGWYQGIATNVRRLPCKSACIAVPHFCWLENVCFQQARLTDRAWLAVWPREPLLTKLRHRGCKPHALR